MLYFGTPGYLDAQFPRVGWKGKGLGLPTGQGSVNSIKEGGEEGK